MKCNHPKCKNPTKTLFATVNHVLFGEICLECQNRIDQQNLEIKAKVKKAVKKTYGKKAGKSPEEIARQRRHVLRGIITATKRSPQTDKVLIKYLTDRGYTANKGTIRNDLRAIGYGRAEIDGKMRWAKKELNK